MTGNVVRNDIQVRKLPEWEMDLAKTTQARYIADLILMRKFAAENMTYEVKRRVYDELMREFCTFDDRLEEEMKDG